MGRERVRVKREKMRGIERRERERGGRWRDRERRRKKREIWLK